MGAAGSRVGYGHGVDVFEALTEATDRGRRAVLVTVISVAGEAPSYPGAKLVVSDGTVLAGTLGCSEFDTAGIELAASVADGDTPALHRRVVFGHGEERALELFAERYDPRPGITVVGDTPVGRAVMALAELLGRRVTMLARDAPGALSRRPAGPREAVLVSDHDAPDVDDVLRVALTSDAFFVGMLGSRRHVPAVVGRLRSAGLGGEALARLRSPCGLDIGSRTPPEIALSIMAEVVAAERGREGGRLGVDWSAS
jgi:xanthine dehydrogenase accessory factor